MASVSSIPRARATERVASIAVYGSAPLALLAVVLMRDHGLLAPTPLWILALILGAGSLTNFVTTVWLRARDDSRLRLHVRVAASVIGTATIIYAVGWGSLLVVAYTVGSAELLRTRGPDTTVPNLLWTWIVVIACEIGVQVGWVPTMIEPGLSHGVAIAGAACATVVTKVLGDSARNTERAEEQVRERATHFEALIEHAADLIGVIAVDGTIVSVSPAVTPMLGYTPEEVAGRSIAEFVDGPHHDDIGQLLAATAHHVGEPASFELRLRHADGSDRLVVATLTMPSSDWGDHIVLNVHDVTKQRDLEQQLRHDARHDSLTSLLNRKAFGEACERTCARAARRGDTVGMLYVDLDGFKQINDTFGHDSGDRVLIEAARRIEQCLASGETLARLGGDEFAVLIDAVVDTRPTDLADTILAELGRAFDGIPNDARVGASIGIALRSHEGIEISTLMRDADAAMYAAKRKGRARWEMTAPEPPLVVEI